MKLFKAFTLAELLIALAILGIVATFTIPKVLTAQADQQKKAVFKETISTLANITYQASQSPLELRTVPNVRAYFQQRLNYAKRCSSDPYGEGCWGEPSWGDPTNADAYVLHNGAAITSINGTGISSGTYGRESLAIDWNGVSPPNVVGDDIINLNACWEDCSAYITGSGAKGAGVVGPGNASSRILYEWVFSN